MHDVSPFEGPTYLNRDLSWLEFNARVLSEAASPNLPLLERIKFLAIFTANLDEFFMVRVAGLKRMLQEDIPGSDSPDGLSAPEALSAIRTRVMGLIQTQYDLFAKLVLPDLKNAGIQLIRPSDLDAQQKVSLREFFDDQIFPVLTPLAVDPAHPFPFLINNAIYLVIVFEGSPSAGKQNEPTIGLIEIPDVVRRLVPVSGGENCHHFVLVEDLVKEHLGELFLGFAIRDVYPIRVTRNLDYTLLESEVVDLLKSMTHEVIKREQQEVVRLEVAANIDKLVLQKLQRATGIDDQFVYFIPGPLRLSGFSMLHQLPLSELKDPPFNPRLPRAMAASDDIFGLVTKEDILVHHPYESFYAVIEFLLAAAVDPDVVAIKQTLYRTSGDSPITEALIKAAENGKHVTAVIELKARFDERNNIEWARRLERSGVAVVFGFIGLKTHCKATLIVRREAGKLIRYSHLSTGNYNSTTAKLYTDIGFFTRDEEIGRDISHLFNLLTGFNVLTGESALKESDRSALPDFAKIALAPVNLRSVILSEIDREIAAHQQHQNGLIIAKMNALVDREIIDKLYEASRAGVTIRLIVRGVCCLRPGVAGLSETITVQSIIDRFLEHSRIYSFHANGEKRTYLASADWMTRNMDRRIELAWPVESKAVKDRLIDEILAISLADNTKSWRLLPNGSYERFSEAPGTPVVRSQERFIDLARAEGIKSLPYDQAIRHMPKQRRGDRPVSKKGDRRRK